MNNKGNYYKIKTKKWFLDKGYFCEYLEKYQRIVKNNKVIYIKKDLAGADGLAMNKDEIIFWNSKFGKNHIAEGLKEFSKYPFPDCVKLWIIVWEKGEREPEIIDARECYDA